MAKAPPLLASDDAGDKLRAAAKAAGLSIAELADLVLESGVAPRPTPDGITASFTLEDLGKRMWGDMQNQGDKAAWFHKLLPAQQNALVCVLRARGYTTELISRELDLSPRKVIRIWNAYHEELGAQVVGVRLETIAGQLQFAAERASEMALAKNDPSTLWRIAKELTGVLQDIGIVDKAIKRVEVTHKIDDEQKAELEKLAQLRAKQAVRVEEIKKIEAQDALVEELPEEVEEELD